MKIYTFTLSNENIDNYISVMKETGNHYHAEKQMLTKSCLAFEEIMLFYQEKFGAEQEVQLKIKKRFSDFTCVLSLAGDCYNPFEKNEKGEKNLVLTLLGLTPHYNYYLGVNQVTNSIKVNQGKKEFRTLLFSFAIGILVGLLGRLLPPAAFEPAQSLVNAISDSLFGLMKMVALPVVFLCLIYGILGSGTVRNFKKNGVRIMRKYLLSIFGMLLFVSVVSILVFNIKIVTAGSEVSAIDNIIDTIFSMVPNNLFTPFAEGDNIKVVVLAMLFGSALLTLGDRVGDVIIVCYQLKELCSTVMSWIGKLIPLLVVVIIVSNIWNGTISVELLSVWKIVIIHFCSILCIFLFTLFRTARDCNMKCKDILHAVSFAGLKGLISSSTMFCYSDMEDGLKNKLKVSEKAVDFGIPLGFSFYHPTTTLLYAVFVLYYSAITGVSVNIPWVFTFLLICFVTGIAVPPVSGGAVTLLASLFAAFGITDEGTAIAFPLLMLLDYPNTAFRVMLLMMEITRENNRVIKQKK